MHWRMQRGADWEREKGARNKRALKRLVTAGRAYGLFAYAKGEPVGWCCLGPRQDFPRLLRSRVLKSNAGLEAWAVVCFYIPARHRGQGIAGALARAAVRYARSRGASCIEGYPVRRGADATARYPATFAFTGVVRVFERAGLREVTPQDVQRPIYRRRFLRRKEDRK